MNKGICFAGGGIKCVSHVGVIKAFEEENIKFDYISGTSSGSIIAVLYALGYTSKEMYELIRKYSKEINYVEYQKIIKLFFDIIILKKIKIDGLNSGKKLEKIIQKICSEKNVKKFTDINKKILIPSVDLCDGKVYIFNSLKNEDNKKRNYIDTIVYDNNIEIWKAVRASCSYPGIFCPCKYKNTKLVDGGIRENVPWRELKNSGADEVLCITFSDRIKKSCNKNIFSVISDSIEILCHELSIYELQGVENRINIEVQNVELLDNKKIDYLYEKGYLSAKKYLKEYKRRNNVINE